MSSLDDRSQDGTVFVLARRIGRLVGDSGLDRTIERPVGDGLLHVGEFYVEDGGTQCAEDVTCFQQHGLRCRIHPIAVPSGSSEARLRKSLRLSFSSTMHLLHLKSRNGL